jgi:hypothetical protein
MELGPLNYWSSPLKDRLQGAFHRVWCSMLGACNEHQIEHNSKYYTFSSHNEQSSLKAYGFFTQQGIIYCGDQ